MIRIMLAALALVCTTTATNAQPAASYPLADGVTVELGEGWTATSMENPAMRSREIREVMDDAREIRFRKQGTGILVSAMKFKPRPGETLDDYDGAGIARQTVGPFLQQAVETEATVESRANGAVKVSLVTLHARPGEQFNVGIGYRGACVSTGNVRLGWLVMAVSIASDSCESDTHRAALGAFLAAHT
jgi:hypothetical protein